MSKIAVLLAVVPALAMAQVSPTCDEPREIDKYQLLRRLSLDLRGKIPSYAEYTTLDSLPTVPASLIQSWLASDDFKTVMREYHERLFWPNVSNVSLNNVNAQLAPFGTPPLLAIFLVNKRKMWRGTSDANTVHGVQCGDFEQTQFTAGFVPAPAGIRTTVDGVTTIKQEGWRWVTPYWSPTPVKVCAFDAMETERVTVGAKTIECNTPEGDAQPGCGCGPNLRFCYGPQYGIKSGVHETLYAAMREQLGRMVDRVSTGGQPYTNLITARQAPINGPLAFWKKYLAPHYQINRPIAFPDPTESVPSLLYTDSSWQDVDRGSDLHAGVLTTPVFLLKFQTNRSRANRLRINFECEDFVPPSALEIAPGNVVDQPCSDTTGDMTKRCTCRSCHRQLEPLAAHFGPFAEAGTTLMSDTALFPKTKAACVSKSPSDVCRRFYVTDSAADNPGALLPYQYADSEHLEISAALSSGPKGRANTIIANGTFARCTVKRAWSYLLKRDMRISGTNTDELPQLESLSQDFVTHDYQLPWLFEQIVSQPAYRRIR